MLAAALWLLLVSPRSRIPRRLLVAPGWTAPIIVAMIGPAALWAFVTTVASGGDAGNGDIAIRVFGLFDCSWFLWAIACGAATRSFQLRSAGAVLVDLTVPAGPPRSAQEASATGRRQR